jgi:hypothetical protein
MTTIELTLEETVLLKELLECNEAACAYKRMD